MLLWRDAFLGASAILLMIAPPSRAQNWVDNDLTALAFVPGAPAGVDGGVPALPESPLAGDWGPNGNNQQHVNFIDPSGHVHELFFDTGNARAWVDNDLTRSGTAAGRGSGIDRYWGSDGSQHVNFIDQNGHIHELFIGGGGGDWVNNDLTALAHSIHIAADRSGLNGYWGSGNSQHVNFIDQQGHVHELFIHPGAEWTDNDLTTLARNGTAALRESRLVGDGGANGNNQQHVNFFDENLHIHELFLAPGASRWVDDDLTSSANGTPSSSIIALSRYWESGGPQHIDYITRDGHIRELVIFNKWIEQDLTAKVTGSGGLIGGTTAGGGSGVTGDEGPNTLQQHINFFDANFHVHELFYPTGATGSVGLGGDDDLTASVRGATASPRSIRVIHRYWGRDGSQHVNYIDTGGHVHELFISGSQGSGGGVGGPGPCPQLGAAGCNCKAGGICNAGLTCANGTTCLACGGVSQPCCPGNSCKTGLSCKFSPAQNSSSCLP